MKNSPQAKPLRGVAFQANEEFTEEEIRKIWQKIGDDGWRPQDFYQKYQKENPHLCTAKNWHANVERVISRSSERRIPAKTHHRIAIAKAFGWTPERFSHFLATGTRPSRESKEPNANSEPVLVTPPEETPEVTGVPHANEPWQVSGSNEGALSLLSVEGKKQSALLEHCDPVIDFEGRDREKHELLECLRSQNGPRIACIHGMPGVGKTQLALKVAAEAHSIFPPDRQLFVSLQSASGAFAPRDVQTVCIHGLGGATELPQGEQEISLIYRSLLAKNRPVLIVADNAADPDQVAALIPPRGCIILVTCREKLEMPETTCYVHPLELAPTEARALLKRICDRIPDEIADKIVRLCGYLPLAIRAAGTLLAVTDDLDPLDYLGQLSDERMRLERIGSAGVPLGVRASFNVSYTKLSSPAATVFRMLGVFPATFDKVAVAACCNDPGGEILSRLVSRGLVLHNHTSKRYRLHDLMRLFAVEKLRDAPPSEEQECRRKNADYFLSILETADRLYGAQTEVFREGLVLFERERINILSAWHWLGSQKNLAKDEAMLCSKFGECAGLVVDRSVSISERLALFGASLRASTQIKNEPAESESICSLSTALYNSGDDQKMREAIKLLRHAATLKTSKRHKASVYWTLGNVYMTVEPREKSKALDAHERAANLAGQTEDIAYAIRATGRLAMTYFENFQPRRARELFQKALDQASDKYKRSRLYVLNFFAQMERKVGRINDATRVSEEARQLAVLFGDKGAESGAVVQLGRIVLQQEPERALAFFRRSLEINEEQGNLRRIAGAHCDIGKAYKQMRRFSEALDAFSTSIRISEQIKWDWSVQQCRPLVDEVRREMLG